jgi:hypothetical protein
MSTNIFSYVSPWETGIPAGTLKYFFTLKKIFHPEKIISPLTKGHAREIFWRKTLSTRAIQFRIALIFPAVRNSETGMFSKEF